MGAACAEQEGGGGPGQGARWGAGGRGQGAGQGDGGGWARDREPGRAVGAQGVGQGIGWGPGRGVAGAQDKEPGRTASQMLVLVWPGAATPPLTSWGRLAASVPLVSASCPPSPFPWLDHVQHMAEAQVVMAERGPPSPLLAQTQGPLGSLFL